MYVRPEFLRTAALTIAWLMVLPCLFVLLSAIVPVIPWVRLYAISVVPNRTSWFFLWSIAALIVGLLALVSAIAIAIHVWFEKPVMAFLRARLT